MSTSTAVTAGRMGVEARFSWKRWGIPITAGLLILASLASLFVGAAQLPASQVLQALGSALGLLSDTADPWADTIIMELRLPRILLGLLVGGALGLSGAMMQGMFRNPLADPTLIGVSSGAALGASTMIVMSRRWLVYEGWIAQLLVPLAAFGAGLLTTLLVYRLAVRGRRTVVATMLLAGIAVNALAFAGTGLWTFVADDAELRDISYWTLGSVAGANWSKIIILGSVMLAAVAASLRTGPSLDALLLGEVEAEHLGVDAHRLRRGLVTGAAAMVGIAVAVSGQISFVGLVVPHVMRLIFGPGHRRLLPLSLLGGAFVLVLSDMIARVVIAPVELPIGIMTAFLGAPFFVWLLRNQGGI
ncbi:MAG: iron ABC transporter permease [Myxococcota bacterium]